MQLTPRHFASLQNDNMLPDVLGSMMHGMQMARAPQMMQQQQDMGAADLKQKMMQNMLTERFGEDQILSKMALQQAQAQHNLMQNRFGGATGDVREALSYAELMNNPNADPLAKSTAQQMVMATLRNKNALNDYRQSMIQSAPLRNATNQGKLSLEELDVNDGFMPGTNRSVMLSPEKQQELLGQYQNLRLKNSTDSTTRTTSQRAENLLKSIEGSNLDDLTRYSGIAGQVMFRAAQARDLTGNPSEEYLKHLEAKQAVDLEAKELRQMLGESISPSASDALYNIVNATTLARSPQAAKRMIEKSRDIIKKQAKTFQDALKSPSGYTQANPMQGAMNQAQSTQGMVVGITPGGKRVMVPEDRINEFTMKGGKRGE